jgi:hypothetical protein
VDSNDFAIEKKQHHHEKIVVIPADNHVCLGDTRLPKQT